MNKKISKILIVAMLVLFIIFSGCVYHGFSENQNVKTSLEYNQKTNSSTYYGTIILIEDDNYDVWGKGPHYIITVYNQSLGSKQKFYEDDLIPSR